MKKVFSFILLFLMLNGQITGQTKPANTSFTISGQLSNCPETSLYIAYRTQTGQNILDTIHLDQQGKFFLRTEKVKEPMIASIQKNRIQINDFFVAPGYELRITGNARDFRTLFESKKISGAGSESNAYRFMLDSILVARMERISWSELPMNELVSYVNKQQKLQDSVADFVFNKKPKQDKYLKFFQKMVRYDIEFQKLYMLLAHVNWGKYDLGTSKELIKTNISDELLSDLYNKKYLVSNYYRTWVISNEWPAYLSNLDKRSDTTTITKPKLQKIYEAYPKGAVKDYALSQLMTGAIRFAKSFTQLNGYKEQFEPYLAEVGNESYVKEIEEKITEKEVELNRTLVGEPAPPFTLKSNWDSVYSLSDFKGKVIYLDLWASWCVPCRAEIPSLKELFNQYKNDDRVVFIGIAVSDGQQEWLNAIVKDQPDWLQLLDKDNTVWKSYVANSIPRYIVIDKKGNIVNFDAPRPSEKNKIEKILNEEIVK
jgi:thiol-disulfide isomerase/thioredoxin